MSRAVFMVQSLLVLGVGIILGYFVFYHQWNSQCAVLLQNREQLHNQTLRKLQDESSMRAAGCVAADKNSEQMQGLLEKHSSMAAKYQDLLEKHEVLLEKLSVAQKENDGSAEAVRALQEHIQRLQRELGASAAQVLQTKQTYEKQIESLHNQLELSKSMLRQKIDEVQKMKGEGTSEEDGDDVSRLHAAIRRRHFAQCLLTLGEGPYFVDVSLDMSQVDDGGSDTGTFQIGFAHLDDMPHSIWTFLSLADQGLYVGTTLGVTQDRSGIFARGGEPSSGSKETQSILLRRYAEYGYGTEPLMFEEVAPRARCSEFTFGLVSRGPELVIPMGNDARNTNFSCPGKITRGKDTLQRLKDTKKRVIIRSTRIVKSDQRDHDWGNEEL